MTATIIRGGIRSFSMKRSDEGHRDYDIEYLVGTDTLNDGPATVLLTPGLPTPGTFWEIGNDLDLYAWCRLEASVVPAVGPEDLIYYWKVGLKFSTKPPPWKGCQGQQIEDPLLQPMKVSGSFSKYSMEGVADKDGNPINNSSGEQIRGQQNEWDHTFGTVKVEQNYPVLQLPLVMDLMNKVNGSSLWGNQSRCVKLSGFEWERLFYGSCYIYFKRSFTFEVRSPYDSGNGEIIPGWDRNLLDEGQMCIRGKWIRDVTDFAFGQWIVSKDQNGQPLKNKPYVASNFQRFKDWNGDYGTCILNGYGVPLAAPQANQPSQPGRIPVQYYAEGDFSQLGIPLQLDQFN
jgi:hypothetical protein